MTVTIFGPCATEDGTTWWVDTIAHRADDRLLVEQRSSFGTLRADQFDRHQPKHVGVDFGHNGNEIGEIVHLEHLERDLVAVAVIDHLEPEDLTAFGALKWSTVTATDRITGSVQLRSIGLVKAADAAAVGLTPVRWIDGDIRRGALNMIGIGQIPKVLARAEVACRHRLHNDPLTIECRAVERFDERTVQTHPDHPVFAPRSESGTYRWVDGVGSVEVEYWPARPGSVLSVR